MKDVLTIVDVTYTPTFENKKGFKTKLVDLVLMQPLLQGKTSENGEKVLVSIKQYGVNLNEFKRILILDETLCLIEKEKSSVEDETLKFFEEYKNHIKVLRGAKLTLEREEGKAKKFDVNKPLTDDNGKPLVDEDGEVMYDYLRDAEGNIVEQLTGFGDTKFVKLELTPTAKKLAEKLVFG